MQPFPNHFHEYYVIGLIENGGACIVLQNKKHIVTKCDMLLFNPGDNHACVQSGEGALDCWGLNFARDVLLDWAEEVTGRRELPRFSSNVIADEEAACHLRLLHELIMEGSRGFEKEEHLLFLRSLLI